MKRSISLTALGAAILTLPSVGLGAQTAEQDVAVLEGLDLTSYNLQELSIPELIDDEFGFELELNGQPLTVVMSRYSLRGPGFQVLIQDGSGVPVHFEADRPSTFRGEILELEGSQVIGGLIGGQLHASIIYQDREWAVQPLTEVYPNASRSQYVVYAKADAIPPPGFCGTDDSHRMAQQGGGTHGPAGSGERVCEIAFECGYDYYTGNGSSVQNTINDCEVILNRMDNIYDNDVDTRFIVTTIHVWTVSGDPYSGDLSTRLNQFRSYWNSNYGFIKRDTAHYMVGGSSGGTIGVAWVGVICNKNYAYGVSRTKFSGNLIYRTALTAHEVGHNYNAGHCSGSTCKIMCASLGGCGSPLTQFGTTSKNVIRNYSFSRSCTPEGGDYLVAPWGDDFEGGSIDGDNWPARQGAEVNANADNETSGSYSLNLDAVNSNPEAQNRIVSNYVLLAGQSGLDVSYNTQHKGVPIGGSLLVEYRQSSGAWEQLDLVVSDGSSQTTFVSHSHSLPSNAYHDEFQLRFIAQGGTGAGSDWYIDDVAVGDIGCPNPTNYCAAFPNSVGDGMFISMPGSNSVADDNLFFVASGGPPNQYGLFFMGTEQQAVFLADGILCIDGSILRFPITQIDFMTIATLDVDYGVPPAVGNLVPGATWNFQFWYRDPGFGAHGSNFTDAVEVLICD